MTQAMVLAAGFGTRLWPLTLDRAKPAVPFLGRPLVRTLVERLIKSGIERIAVNTHYRPESIRNALSDLPVRFSHEPEILGTAGCLAQAIHEGHLRSDAPVLVVNGKLHTTIPFDRVLEVHRASGAAVTMVLKPNLQRAHFREVKVDGGRVVGFGLSRVPESDAPLLFTGIHVIAPRVLVSLSRTFSDTIRDVYPPFIQAGEVFAYVDDDHAWGEFSTVARYIDLHRQAIEAGQSPSVVCVPGATVEPGANVGHAILWENARIEAGATVNNAVLCAGVVVHSGETLEDAVLVRRDLAPDDSRGQVFGSRLRVLVSSGSTS